jgi:mRNA interferase MazF
MVTINQGDIWWADLSEPIGSSPGYRRPVIIVQGDSINRSKISTVVCIPLTSNMGWVDAPGNVELTKGITGLSKDSIANVSQILTIDKRTLTDRVGKLPNNKLQLILLGIDIIIGR